MRIELKTIEQIDLLEDGLLEAKAVIIDDDCEGRIEKIILEGVITYVPQAETPEEDVGFGYAAPSEYPVIVTAWIHEGSEITHEDFRTEKVSPEELLNLGWKAYEIERA